MRILRKSVFILLFFIQAKAYSQDTTEPWFPGGDPGFYRYLEDRLMTLGSQKPALDRTGEAVIIEFWITDSGYFDSVKIGQCFNFQLCFQLRQILNTMPRANATVVDGKTVAERRVYALDVRRFRDGYTIEPSFYVPTTGSAPSKFKWGIAIIAVVAIFVVIFK
ncbi:MAG: hypothetical protein KG003_15735 [Bacteroidetes bacterium]|nr:hypothetical protein [Bacteroidota bacterium]